MLKFLLVMLAGIVGNGLGAWNIRTISSGRFKATAVLTFCSAVLNMTAVRTIVRDVNPVLVIAWALGSTVGIVGMTWVDRKFFHKDFGS